MALKEITDRLPEFEFDLITAKLKRGLPDFERIGNVNVHRIGAGNIFDKPLLPNLGFLKALNFHKKKKYDLIHGIMASQGSAAAYLFKFFNKKIPFVLTLQEGDLGRNSPFDKFWQRRIIKRADAITAISAYLAEFAIRFNKKAPIDLIPNGAVMKVIGSMYEDVYTKRDKVKSNNQKIIITVSRLVSKNGIDTLIKSVRELKTDNWRLRIIGDGSERSKLEKLTEKLGITDKVEFLGSLPNEQIIPGYLMAKADVFVRPSRSEGLGISFLEALAAGVPIVGTSVGGIPDFLKDGETGLFCKMDDPKDLAEKIDRLLGDENLSRKLAENGRKLVEEKYNWNNIAKQVRAVYEKTINNNSSL